MYYLFIRCSIAYFQEAKPKKTDAPIPSIRRMNADWMWRWQNFFITFYKFNVVIASSMYVSSTNWMDKSTFCHLNDLHALKIQFPTATTAVVTKRCGCWTKFCLRRFFSVSFQSENWVSCVCVCVCDLPLLSIYCKRQTTLINNKWQWITSCVFRWTAVSAR